MEQQSSPTSSKRQAWRSAIFGGLLAFAAVFILWTFIVFFIALGHADTGNEPTWIYWWLAFLGLLIVIAVAIKEYRRKLYALQNTKDPNINR